MAGDWIKMRADLFTHPKVFKIADKLKKDELYVVGALLAFWSWSHQHAVDGRVDGATSHLIDRATRVDGLADALVSVGWLEVDETGIGIPRFEVHNGDSAKERSLKNERQARWRERKKGGEVDGGASTTPSTKASTREEKRRSKPPTPESGEDEEGFKAFWTAWPACERKQDKAKCAEHWRRHALDAHASAILADVRLKAETRKWRDGFIEAPLVYLRGKRWEDGATPSDSGSVNDLLVDEAA